MNQKPEEPKEKVKKVSALDEQREMYAKKTGKHKQKNREDEVTPPPNCSALETWASHCCNFLVPFC